VTFTTGTTGVPQPVVRSHAVLRGQHDALERLRPTRTGDVDLAGLPMLVLHDLARGVPVVLGRSRGAALAATVRGLGVTTAGGFPPLFEDLVRHAPPGGYPALRAVHVGGAPVSPELVRRVGSVAPGATLTVVYGATEAEPIGALDGAAYLALNEAREPGDGICVGLPVAGLQVRLGGHEWTEGAGATVAGRLEVRGSQVVAAAGGEGGWRDTGDLARVDREGRIWLLGRASAAVDGVPPLVIEQAAEAIAGVAAAALLPAGTGRPRPTLALAVDTGERGAVPRIARRVIQERWPGLDVVGLPALPRERRSGKIDLRRLARLVAA
jgi:acyl-coenzyme A synthetase/AMP-(fatty) acid ligase